MLFEKITEPNPIPQITPEIAQEIYGKYKEYNIASQSECFSRMGKYPKKYFDEVKEEMDRLENVVITAMNSENKPQSKSELRQLLSSDLIDCDLILNDIIDYILVYEENTTREDFISQFANEGIII